MARWHKVYPNELMFNYFACKVCGQKQLRQQTKRRRYRRGQECFNCRALHWFEDEEKVFDLRDTYEVLQISPNAEAEIIDAAYRKLAQKYHPDHNDDPDANEKMRKINLAYEEVRDKTKRRK